MHIIIAGEIGVGKTTLINRLLQGINRPVHGFRTEKVDKEPTGISRIYMHPARGGNVYSESNTVGFCFASGAKAVAGAFDRLGVTLLTGIVPDSVVLMDELGLIESKEQMFCDRVLHILDEPCFVLAAVKTADTPFLESVRSHQNALTYNINKSNRGTLYERILDDLRRFDPDSPFLSKARHC